MKTEVPKSPSTVSTLKTEVQKSPAEKSSSPPTEEASKVSSAPVREAVKTEPPSSPDTLNSVKSTAETLSTEKTDRVDHEPKRVTNQLKTAPETAQTAVAIPEHPTNQAESSDSALVLALINYIERRELNVHGQRSENLKKLRKLAAGGPSSAVPRG